MQGNARHVLQAVLEALVESYDDVRASHDGYVEHPANAGKRSLIMAQLSRHARATALVGQLLKQLGPERGQPELPGAMTCIGGGNETRQHEEPELTDGSRQALLWLLAKHMSAESEVGEVLRYALGMGAGEPMSRAQLEWGAIWEGHRWDARVGLPEGVTTRVLTELAAEAIGLSLEWADLHQMHWVALGQDLVFEPWNPVSDDGTEARLESDLNLAVNWLTDGVRVGGHCEAFANHGGDKQAARRYAGTAAAALVALAARARTLGGKGETGRSDGQGQPKRCAADRDGDCSSAACPQLRDGEPHASGRHCPLDRGEERG